MSQTDMQKDAVKKSPPQKKSFNSSGAGRHSSGRRKPAKSREEEEFSQQLIDLARVTRVTAGGKRMRFRACIGIGDKKGRIGIGVAKGSDVTDAINKAVLQAKKSLVDLAPYKGKMPHELEVKYGAARVFMKPGRKGDGIIAGGVVRNLLEISGFEDVVAKMFGSKNKINNAKAVMKAFQSFIVTENIVAPKNKTQKK